MTELHETRMGQTLIAHTLPELVRQVARLADALERIADSHGAGGEPQPSDRKESHGPQGREEGTQPENH